MDSHSKLFISALENNDLESLRKIPKVDFHNHFALGGNRTYIYDRTGIDIGPLKVPIHSMDEMHHWVSKYLGQKFHSFEMRKLKIEASFYQAKIDGVKILEIGEDVWGLGTYFDNDLKKLVYTFKEANQRIAPEVELRLQIGLSRHCSISYLEGVLEPYWDSDEFYSIDLYGDELVQPIENFKHIYRRAKDKGLKLKAHVGEWGTSGDVIRAVEVLELDEIQHGIAIHDDINAMTYIRDRKIPLHMTPTSNLMLGRVKNLEDHPIRKIYDYGISVTINSDDLLIFDSDVSKEYLSLYNHKVLSKECLDEIRMYGLNKA